MSDKKQQSRDAFNRQAPTYDRDRMGRHARSLYPAILKRLSSITYQTALDLGCGTGELMKSILMEDRGKSLYGFDLSERMLEVAKSKLGDTVTLALGDSEHLPFPDSFFDVVYCNDSFHHYPMPGIVFDEVYRVLKPHGTFIICDCWHSAFGRAVMNLAFKHSREGDVKIYSRHELCRLFSACFSNVTWERLGHHACMACGVKPGNA